jgi:hypothetical protein
VKDLNSGEFSYPTLQARHDAAHHGGFCRLVNKVAFSAHFKISLANGMTIDEFIHLSGVCALRPGGMCANCYDAPATSEA